MSFARFGFAMFALVCAHFVACNAIVGNEPGTPFADASAPNAADGSNAIDGAAPESGAADGPPATPGDGPAMADGPPLPGDGGPNAACRPIPLPCLDFSPANVRDVPGETTFADAIANAVAGDTVQVHGPLQLASGWRLPPYVTLHGCDGAKIVGTLAFQGSGGTVEGFEVSGGIVANQTGDFVIRYNRFVAPSDVNLFAVSARSIDALVSASVTATVDSNWFTARTNGVEADTQYDTMIHAVKITVRNNVFTGVNNPIRMSEGGLVGAITPLIEQNTFYKFDNAIALYSIKHLSSLGGNLFAQGTTAVVATSAFEVSGSMIWQVTQATSQMAPASGTFATGDPAFVNPGADDFRLRAPSFAIDAIPNDGKLPAVDYFGCPRPIGFKSSDPKGDIGALEAQR